MPKAFHCKASDCPYPNDGSAQASHNARYHSSHHQLPYNGSKVPIDRDPETQLLPCPCGSPLHACYSYKRLYDLCHLDPHPAPDVNPLPEKPRSSSITLASQLPAPTISDQHPVNPMVLEDFDFGLGPDSIRESFCDDKEPSSGMLPAERMPSSQTVIEEERGSRSCPPLLDTDDVMNLDTPLGGNENFVSFGVLGVIVEEIEDSGEENVDVAGGEGEADGDEGGYYSGEEEDILDEDTSMDIYEDILTEQAKERAMSALHACGIHVEPVYHLTICIKCKTPVSFLSIHSHLKNKHPISRYAPKELRLPSVSTIRRHLQVLGATSPLKLPDGPIRPLQGVKTIKGFKCTTRGCGVIKGAYPTLTSHWRNEHKRVPASERSRVGVDCQPSGGFRNVLTYVEVHSVVSVTSSAREQMQKFADDLDLLNPSEVFNVSENSRDKNPVFAQTKWDRELEGVHMGRLMSSALAADVDKEPELERLRLALRGYYEDAVEVLPSLPILTRRYLRSSNPESDLKDQPFRRPQERGTILKDSDCVARFLSFLIRTGRDPLANCSIALLKKLEDSSSDEEELKILIHDVVWKILSTPSDEYRRNELMCPFTRFLIAVHIRDSRGTFVKPQLVSPTIARAQWCFRATAALELIRIRDEYDGDIQRAYDERVKIFMTDKHTVLFTTLRQHMKYFSALAYRQQGLARFNFNPKKTVVDMDGFPIRIADVSSGVKDSLESVRQGMKRVFRLCDYKPILKHIEDGMNPDDSAKEKWFRDVPQEDKYRYSLFEEETNGFGSLRSALLDSLVEDPNLFSMVNGKLVADPSACSEWLSQVNDLVKELYFLVCTTWGGGARGTEVEGLLYANHPRRRRNMFFMNGFLTMITEYNKTQSQTGAGKTIARTPSFEVNCLLLLLLSVVYYAASHISLFLGMRKADAQRYLYEIFVLSGKSMTPEQFSSALGTFTSTHLGIHLGLRDFRQFMSCCLITFTQSTFFDTDDEDVDLRWLHEAFGHSKDVGESHYGLEVCNSGTTLTSTAISNMLRVSLRWHEFINQLHPLLRKATKTLSKTSSASTEQLNELLKSHFASLTDQMKDFFMYFSDRLIASMRSELETFGTQLIHTLTPAGKIPTLVVRSPPSVHPRISQALGQILRRSGSSPLRFTSPEQAELINSAGSSSHILGVIETGGGKSLAFFGATCLFPDRLFLVITPLNALTNDLERRLLQFGIRGGVYGSPGLDFHSAQIILVSAHIAGTQQFSDWIESSAVKDRLKRVFIDECHKVVTDQTYRRCFSLFWYLTKAAVPITFLTATIMPRSVPFLLDTMMISDHSLVEEIRRYTGRPNLKYEVEEINGDTYVDEVKSRVVELEGRMAKDERGLIFTRTIVQAETIARTLGIPYYVSVLDSDPLENHRLKVEAEKRWRMGEEYGDRWMSATQAFGNGIDYAKVRYIYLLDPSDILEFAQEMGRAGRDGLPSRCVTLWWRLPMLPKDPSIVDHEGRIEMREFLQTRDCLRLSFACLDRESHSCVALNGELCSNCERMANTPYGYTPADRPRFDKPLVPIPNAEKEPVVAEVAASVETNAMEIESRFDKGKDQLDVLKRVLERVVDVGCVDCWVLGHIHTDSTIHDRNVFFRTHLNQIRQLQLPYNNNWPYCFLCWVPLRQPFNHPPPTPNQRIDPEKCSFRPLDSTTGERLPILPWMIAIIFGRQERDSEGETFAEGVGKALGVRWRTIRELCEWLRQPMNNLESVPNPVRFVIAFYNLYRQLPDVE
ncbi:hypothetical protein AAF712_005695 [Marasmius tenuissimus]|uniref:DNA 3'-5' helicase n=1 Tax=Marasmius tenuissimus TaxID=585030 RepID=A0ABR3A1T1_9AGAR